MSIFERGRGQRSDDTMDDDSDDKDTKRKSRNLSEKKRRDQFNVLVNELSSMVSCSGRKMDKSTVLKATISFLKNHNEIAVRSRVHEIQQDWKPSFLTNEEFTHLVLEAIDGFLMVFSTSGRIFYASESITSLLGHLPNEVLNMTIYEMTSEDEQNNLYNALLSPVEEDVQIAFSCHLRRAALSCPKQPNRFELINFVGFFRTAAEVIETDETRGGYCEEVDTRLLFVGTGRLQTPQLIRELSPIDSTKSEFTSRHSLEWKFLFLDHRAPPIIGYLPFELLGTSGYDYYHVDDLEMVVTCHEALMQKGEGTSCYYRFLTKGQQWIWLQTRFYITYHQWNSKPEFIVCTHRVVSYVDVLKRDRKENKGRTDVCDTSSPFGNNASATSCPNKSPKSTTPTSADSSGSKISVIKRQSAVAVSRANRNSTSNVPNSRPTFVEPPRYVAAIPIQPIFASLPTTAAAATVLSPLDVVDMAREHADLQRKHAELQIFIEQQQAELRMVSEQLLIARLGLLPQHQTPESSNVNTEETEATSCPYNTSSGTVSSTTATIAGRTVSLASIPVSTDNTPSTMEDDCLILNSPRVTHQPNVLYTPPDSNTPPNLAELK